MKGRESIVPLASALSPRVWPSHSEYRDTVRAFRLKRDARYDQNECDQLAIADSNEHCKRWFKTFQAKYVYMWRDVRKMQVASFDESIWIWIGSGSDLDLVACSIKSGCSGDFSGVARMEDARCMGIASRRLVSFPSIT